MSAAWRPGKRGKLYMIAAILGVSAPAAAQQASPCITPPLPFAPTTKNQVKGERFAGLLHRRTVIYVRDLRDGSGQTRITVTFRDDGSALNACEFRPARGGNWIPCQRISGGHKGNTDLSVGEFRNGLYCSKLLRVRESQETCWSLHLEGGRYLVKRHTGAWLCMEGEVMFQ